MVMPGMPIEQAVFARIDTADSQPYLEGSSCGELVVSALCAGRDKGWYNLLGFVILPSEIQLLLVPGRLLVSSLVASLEAEVYPMISVLKPVGKAVFDADFYREKVDYAEEIRQRLRWMHLAPVRARLATLAEAYPFSSANPRYRDVILPLKVS
jgi:hypothetical protein